MASTQSDSGLLTEKQLASLYAVSVATVQKWRYKGEGPAWIRLGARKCVRYRREDALAFLQSHVRSAGGEK